MSERWRVSWGKSQYEGHATRPCLWSCLFLGSAFLCLPLLSPVSVPNVHCLLTTLLEKVLRQAELNFQLPASKTLPPCAVLLREPHWPSPSSVILLQPYSRVPQRGICDSQINKSARICSRWVTALGSDLSTSNSKADLSTARQLFLWPARLVRSFLTSTPRCIHLLTTTPSVCSPPPREGGSLPPQYVHAQGPPTVKSLPNNNNTQKKTVIK